MNISLYYREKGNKEPFILLHGNGQDGSYFKNQMKYPNRVKALILNGGNLNPRGVKITTQLPIEIGYKIARRFASKSHVAKRMQK